MVRKASSEEVLFELCREITRWRVQMTDAVLILVLSEGTNRTDENEETVLDLG